MSLELVELKAQMCDWIREKIKTKLFVCLLSIHSEIVFTVKSYSEILMSIFYILCLVSDPLDMVSRSVQLHSWCLNHRLVYERNGCSSNEKQIWSLVVVFCCCLQEPGLSPGKNTKNLRWFQIFCQPVQFICLLSCSSSGRNTTLSYHLVDRWALTWRAVQSGLRSYAGMNLTAENILN